MKYYVDSQGYLMSLNPIEGGIEVDAPLLEVPLSQNQLVDGQWILSDVVPQRVIDEINALSKNNAEKSAIKLRLQKLIDSDWTDTASAPGRLGSDVYDQWQTYRQALRDITKQPGYPLEIDWPVAPF